MNLQQLQALILSECLAEVSARIILPAGESPTQAQLEAEFLIYKQELIDAEIARLAEEARIADLHLRWANMPDHGVIQGEAGISNPALHFKDSIINASNAEEAETILSDIEVNYAAALLINSQSEVNSEARSYLAATDWYVTRFIESGVAIPQDISDARAAARSAIVT